MESIRVMIADDHALFRAGLCSLLDSIADIEVVGEAATGQQVLTLASERQPDVILMDIQMPGMDGIETTKEVRKRLSIPIVALTAYARKSELESFLQAGMDAAVTKPIDEEELLRVIGEQTRATA